VQRSCYRCGASLDDQAPFCPSCGAAQIRVTAEQQTPQQPQSDLAPGISADAGTSVPAAPTGVSVQYSGQIQRKSLLLAALPLSLLAGLVCALDPRFGWLVLLGIVVYGVLRHQRRDGGPMSAGIGARLGALIGLLTFVSFLLLGTLRFGLALALGQNGNEIREEMVKQVQQIAARNPDPQAQEIMRWFATSEGLVVLVGLSLFLFFIFFLVSATATGAVTGALADKKPRE
jgi:hypothetical protein